ncbi:hypothetical protein AN639_06960 [Candidatus Epulonipiscium fishelsonii]|uniref:Uncharacterized protein n=1 Tax=Candidatus Epulonipiscium fishelsonii TaxID=77094 RepID=A0ACC8XGN0_9FIRM|nr:hypothetical protein AN639_06960 [Epulopiscium sp. SCG-B05WGA-EpuloA1]ONI42763.1 hypothetical protein AN396_13265 [Epulopiscium sp. SCG-B11WGA-EpuloA1]
MTNILIKLFVKDYKNINSISVKQKYGILASVVGIMCNLFLCVFTFIIGITFSNIAITADAINSLSDIGSSIISIISFKISNKPADKEHPYGHARFEYICGLAISSIIIMLGITIITSSVKKILNPNILKFNITILLVLGTSILLKLWLSKFNKEIGEKINSQVLKAAATDSLSDVLSTASVFISIIFSYFTGIQIEGFMGIFVAILIIRSGVNIVKDMVNTLLGEAPPKELTDELTERILQYDGVLSMHGLLIHIYGENHCFASAHVEVDAKQNIITSHDIIDKIEKDIYKDLGINLVIHIDPI